MRLQTIVLLLLALLGATSPLAAQELLLNRSFESPVAPANGNNFYATIANWTISSVTPAQALPVNLIKPDASYGGGPTATPTGGGLQYFDVNSASGVLRQTVTVPSQGMIDFSGWFSVRDSAQALNGLTINILDSGGAIVATASTSFLASDAFRLWKQASGANVPVSAGTYTFEVIMPNPANLDLASFVFKPAATLNKSSAPYSDPENGTTNPKLIPGGVAEYTIVATTPASYAISANTVVIGDATPANTDLVVADIGVAGSGPASFAAGTSGLTYSFTSLASATDNIDFSNNSGATWTYTPTANANGTDANVTNVRARPQGTMAASSSATLRLRYRIR
jgi:trimeric autotransporter adhesin